MKRTIQLVLSLALSGLFIWLSLRGAPLSEVWQALLVAEWKWVALFWAFCTAIHFVRVVRWGLLVEPVVKIRFRDLNAISAVGFMALIILPLRLGEFARPYLLSKYCGVRQTAALASVVVERLIDGVSVGLLLVVLLWTVTPQAGAENFAVYRVAAAFVTGGFSAGLAFVFFAFRHRDLANRILRRILGIVSERLADKAAAMLDSFTDALKVVPNWRRAAEILALTALNWTLAALGLKAMAPAFGLFLEVPHAFTVLGLQVVGSMLPAGPGMTGPLQFAIIKGVELFTGPGQHAAVVAFAHVVWASQVAQQSLFGLAYVVSGRVRLGDMWARMPASEASVAATE